MLTHPTLDQLNQLSLPGMAQAFAELEAAGDYRSSAGRASVEFQTFDLCESYRRSHADASIYYEDETLRVYRFRAR